MGFPGGFGFMAQTKAGNSDPGSVSPQVTTMSPPAPIATRGSWGMTEGDPVAIVTGAEKLPPGGRVETWRTWFPGGFSRYFQTATASPAGVIAICGSPSIREKSNGAENVSPTARVAIWRLMPVPSVLARSQAATVLPAASMAISGLLASLPGFER